MSSASRARNQSPFTRPSRVAGARWRRTASAAVALALTAVTGVVTASPATAAPDESHASARFVSGTVGGTSLDDLVALEGVEAHYDGGGTPVIEADTLNLSVLGTIDVPIGPTTVPLDDLLTLGAVNQYAEAAPAARSRAAAGAVSDTGAVNTAGSGTYPADATVSLDALLGQAPLDGVIDAADIRLRALSAVAGLDGSREQGPAITCADLSDPVHCRDYTIAGGELVLSAPVLGDLTSAVTGLTAQLTAALAGLETDLESAVESVLSGVTGVTAPLAGVIDVSADIDANTAAALDGVINTELSDGVVTIDLASGTITADLEALSGRALDNLPPNTEIMSAALLEELAERVAALLATVPSLVESALTSALSSASVSITGGACVAGTGDDCVQELVPGTDTGTGFAVDISGTLGDLDDATIDLMLKVAGTELPVGPVVTQLRTALAAAVSAELGGDLVDTVTAGLLTVLNQVTTALAPALEALNDLVSLLANVQEAGTVAGSYREVALRVALGAAAGATGIAQVDLARVEVGPNVLGTEAARPAPTLPGSAGAAGTPSTEALPNVGAPDALITATGGLLMLATGVLLLTRRRIIPS